MPTTDPKGRRSGDDGAVTPWFVAMVLPMVMMAGLAFDGGRVLTERRAALDAAQNASRAGAQAIDITAARQGNVAINPALVDTAVQNYLTTHGHTGTTTIAGNTVTVTVTETVDMAILNVIGVNTKTVTGTATSRLVRGIDKADQ